MSFWADERGAAIQVGAIIIFAFLVIAIASYQASVVPSQNKNVEFNYNQQVQSQVQDVHGAIESTAAVGNDQTVTVDLATSYPARTIFINPPPPTGTLRSVGTTHDGVSIEVANAIATDDDIDDYWDGTTTQNYSTGALTYDPNYHVYTEAPVTVVENSIVYNIFDDSTSLSVTSQSMFDGDRISLTALRGTLREQGGTASVTVQPISTSTQTITVEDDGTNNVTVSVVSRLSEEQWRQILLDEEEFYNQSQGGHVVSVTQTDTVALDASTTANVITFEMELGETYTLQMARVGVGQLDTGDRTTNASYSIALVDQATTGEDVNQTLTYEVRDQYNNPLSGVTVNATVAGSVGGNVVDGTLTTDEDGRVTFTYNTTENIDGSAKTEDVRVSHDSDPATSYDASDPADVETQVTVKNTDGSGTGGGGGGGGGAYTITFDDAPSDNWNVDAEGSTITITASTDPALDGVSTDFAVNNSSVATISNEDAETDSNGDTDVELTAQANGTVAVYVMSAGSSDVINVSVTGVEPTDNTPPTFSGETPTPSSTVTNDQPTMSVDVSDGSGIDSGSISVTVQDASGTTHLNNAGTGNEHVSYSSGTITIDPSGSTPFSLADGTVDVTVEADDTAGNTGSTSWSFTVDAGGPTFSNRDPIATTETTNQPTMTVDISDPSGIDSSSISVTVTDGSGTTHLNDAGTGDAHVSFSGGTLTIDPTAGTPFTLSDGTTSVTVEAADSGGNTGSTSWSFTVDTTGPTLTNPSPDGTTTPNEHQPITLDIADATSSVDASSISVTVTDADGTVLSSVGTGNEHVSYSGGTLTIDPTAGSTQFAWANGSVSVSVSASDSVGNSNSQAWSFTVDAIPPTIEFFNVVDDSSTFSGYAYYTASWNLTDNEAVDTFTVYINQSGNGIGRVDETNSTTNDSATTGFLWGGDGSTYDIKVVATDAAGNRACMEVSDVADGFDPADADYQDCGSSGGSDTGSPAVTSASVSNAPISYSDASTTQTVTVNFNESMDQNVDPTVEITGLPNSNDLSVTGGTWIDATTWEGTVDFPQNEDDATATISVQGAEDDSGNTMSPNPDTSQTVTVDTDRPNDPAETRIVTDPVNASNDGSITVEVDVDNPDADGGTVYVRLEGKRGTVVVESASMQTGSGTVTTTVSGIDVSALADADPGENFGLNATARVVDDVGNENPSGYAARSDGVLKDTNPPTIDQFNASNPSGSTIDVVLQVNETLSDISVDVEDANGNVVSTLVRGDFTQNCVTADTCYYNASVTVSDNDDYTAVLNTARDDAENDGASGETDTASVVDYSNQKLQPVKNVGEEIRDSNTVMRFRIENTAGQDVTIDRFSVNASGIAEGITIDASNDPELSIVRTSIQNGYADRQGNPPTVFNADGTTYWLVAASQGNQGQNATLASTDGDVEIDIREFSQRLDNGGTNPLVITDSPEEADVVVTVVLSDGSTQVFYFKQS